MSEVKQTTVNPAAPSDKPLGARNERNLQKSFSASPIYNGELDDAWQIWWDSCSAEQFYAEDVFFLKPPELRHQA